MDKEIIKSIFDEFYEKNQEKIAKLDIFNKKALSIPEYLELDNRERMLTMELGKQQFLKQKTDKIVEELTKIKESKKLLLEKNNININDYTYKINCKKCNDTGINNGKYCTCFLQAYNNIIMNNCGIDLSSIPYLKDYDINIFDDEQRKYVQDILTNLKKYVKNFGNGENKNILLVGGTGVGKTYLAQCVAKEIIKEKNTVFFTSAFNLNNTFLKIHVAPELDKITLLKNLLEVDLLIIDDLGTEPMLNNVTKEYLQLLLNERLINNKSTFITSNLDPNTILERYEERIFSRITNKRNTLMYNLVGKDLRVKR